LTHSFAFNPPDSWIGRNTHCGTRKELQAVREQAARTGVAGSAATLLAKWR
jgi:hypothetical protein